MLPNCRIEPRIARWRSVGGVRAESICARSAFRYKAITIRAQKRDARFSPDTPLRQY